MMEWKKRLEAQFDFVKENIQNITKTKNKNETRISYYYFDEEHIVRLEGHDLDFESNDYIAYNHIINGYL